MFREALDYLTLLTERFGAGWNNFWFRRSDPLVLCLMRLLTGLAALYFVASYTPDLIRWFGPNGMLPTRLVDQLQPDGSIDFSYFSALRTDNELWAAHAIGLGIVTLFTLGLFSRITSVLALVVVLSYVHRAPLVTGHFEWILALVMFYLCFAPTGAALSLDAWLARRKANRAAQAKPTDGAKPAAETSSEPLTIRSLGATIATRLIQLHIAAVYLMMGVSKLAGGGETNPWWMGDAVWWLMVRPDAPLFDLAELFKTHPYFVNAWTHAIVLFELAFGILIWNRLARPLLLAIAVPMWLSLAVITGLTPFCVMMLIANLAYVSPAWLRAKLCTPTASDK